ncbi:MAG: hypothetical protein JNL75_10145 [Chitinophagales bacterium]|nr:hypothetical protein [Chitinophagales bacterium]
MLSENKTYFLLLIIAFLSCDQNCIKDSKVLNGKDPKSVQYECEIDTSVIKEDDNFYQVIKLSDTSSYLKWGNKETTFYSKTEIDNFYLEKERLHFQWINKKFICLGRSSGSDIWLNIILPLKEDAKPKIYENALAFDKENGLVICEGFIHKEAPLKAENIYTGETEILGKNWTKCDACSFYHYCIDSISIKNRELYVKWATPHKLVEKPKFETKRVKLKI